MPLDSDVTDRFVYQSPKRIIAAGATLFVLLSIAAAIDFTFGGQYSAPSPFPLI